MQTLAVWGAVVAGLAGGYCIPVYAAPPEGADPALAPWFKDLRQPETNRPCCDMADCRTVEYRTFGEQGKLFVGYDRGDFDNEVRLRLEAGHLKIDPNQIIGGFHR